MYNARHLFRVARRGLADMLPALEQVLNDRHDDDRLDRVFGPWPRLTLLAVTVIGILLGYGLQNVLEGFFIFGFINIAAVLFGAGYALVYRRYLFHGPAAGEDDFPWLAAALMTTIYLAIIGGTWTVCRRSFGRLLRDGEVDVLETLRTMAETPNKRRRAARKARKRAVTDARAKADQGEPPST